ncbi:hypothetical protein QR680_006872 [Steinernema hermaphroditum]|uniref:Uncharacterized protein n=1 Tax=Steinernema hermaphroditum TaxID=289476 RepID=A0AA39HY11_9BILA|nr:hypothetical protein QR680_006872 [Steinernema hermaphroditum]
MKLLYLYRFEILQPVEMRTVMLLKVWPLKGKNPFLTIGNDKSRRRSSQFDRALHRIYSTPRPIFGVKVVDQLIARVYWSIRSVQFRLFYKNEGLFSPAKPCPLPRTGLSN